MNMGKSYINICCERFGECVDAKEIVHSNNIDETEWYVPEWHHLYFCPFCGANIKGEGFGNVSKQKPKRSLAKKL